MREFEKQEIQGTIDFFEEKGFTKKTEKFADHQIEYYVIPQSMNPSLPDFAMRMTNEADQLGVFGVSDSVPEHLRAPWAMHEMIEFMQIGISEEGRCASAEREVLNRILPEHQDEYVNRRIIFFNNLVSMFQSSIENGEDHYNENDVMEVKGTLNFLKRIQS